MSDESDPFVFAVRYRLREYVAFAVEHAVATEPLVRAASPWKVRLFRAALATIAAVLFFYKTARTGVCEFEIDHVRITRRSRLGVSSVPWERVVAVRRYAPGWLLELRQGAVPLPTRVLPSGVQALLAERATDAAPRMAGREADQSSDR